MFESGYDEIEPADESQNVSFLLTLLTTLDFTNPGQVLKEDWERGIAALHAPGLSWEVSWQMLLRRFDLDFNGSIDFGEMVGLAPLSSSSLEGWSSARRSRPRSLRRSKARRRTRGLV